MATPTCDGCLGNRRCWVCVGTGRANPMADSGVCLRCRGTGRCPLCQPLPEVAVIPPRAPEPADEDRRAVVEIMTGRAEAAQRP